MLLVPHPVWPDACSPKDAEATGPTVTMPISQSTIDQPIPEPSPAVVPDEVLFGYSEPMREVHRSAKSMANSGLPVLISGESGTGKGLLARWLHLNSPRRPEPFVPLNCAAVPQALMQTEFFGFERGAYTGATSSRAGWAEAAGNGTLFLDEIAELDFSSQGALLQLLQDGEFSRVGGREVRSARFALVSACKRDLELEVNAGRFREDLYYRISVLLIRLPPLRDRRCDIPLLVDHFLKIHQERYRSSVRLPSAQVMRLLMEYDWPGNIRELETSIKNYLILGSEESLRADLGRRGTGAAPGAPRSLRELTRNAASEFERRTILETLAATHWNRREAARALGISYRSLFYKMRAANIGSKRVAAGRPEEIQ